MKGSYYTNQCMLLWNFFPDRNSVVKAEGGKIQMLRSTDKTSACWSKLTGWLQGHACGWENPHNWSVILFYACGRLKFKGKLLTRPIISVKPKRCSGHLKGSSNCGKWMVEWIEPARSHWVGDNYKRSLLTAVEPICDPPDSILYALLIFLPRFWWNSEWNSWRGSVSVTLEFQPLIPDYSLSIWPIV